MLIFDLTSVLDLGSPFMFFLLYFLISFLAEVDFSISLSFDFYLDLSFLCLILLSMSNLAVSTNSDYARERSSSF